MYKKTFSILMCCFLFFNLFGCGLNNNTDDNSLNNKVTIRFSWWGGEDRHDKTAAAIKEFEKLNPNIKVKLEFSEWTGFKKKMNMRIEGNDEPDLMQINYDWLESYSKDGAGFYDLNKVKDSLGLENFSEETLNYGTKNGVLNAIPIAMNAKAMYYNKSLMKKFGINDITTWDDLLTNNQLITDNNTYMLKLDETNSWLFAMTYMKEKTGKDFITAENTLGFSVDDIKELLDFYKSLLDNKIIQPLNTVNLYDFSNNDNVGLASWASDASKMEKSILKANGESSVLPLPSINGTDGVTYVKPSMLYAISKNTEHPKEAALLMNFLLNNSDSAEILGLDRGIPTSKAAYNALESNNMLTGLQFEAMDKTSNTQNVLINPYFENTSIKKIYNQALTDVTFGSSSTSDIANNTYTSLNEALESLK